MTEIAELEGTEKQVKWAESLRQRVISALEKEQAAQSKQRERYAARGLDTSKLDAFLNIAEEKLNAVRSCRKAKAFIETRPNPTNGAEREWAKIIRDAELVFSGNKELIQQLAQPGYGICWLGSEEAEILGYDRQSYIAAIKSFRA